jgi:uncharacterized protein YbcV (DUF1398 family)
MFTIDQIKQAHSKVKSGADFPRYVQDLIKLGLKSYITYVSDGHTVYSGEDPYVAQSDPKYPLLKIADASNKTQFQSDLKDHQQGRTNYPTFCLDCAKSGIEKWVVDMSAMTCTYYDRAGQEMLVENIEIPLLV